MNPSFQKCLENIKYKAEDVNQCLSSIDMKKVYSPGEIKFIKEGTMYYYTPKIIPQSYVAAFDVDWTIAYSQNKMFPNSEKDINDIYLMPLRERYLVDIFKLGYTIVLFTNQSSRTVKEANAKVERMKTLIRKIPVPVFMFIATGKAIPDSPDKYRKPAIGMWEKAKEFLPNIEFSFYSGDAAGRIQDFSDSDKKFAENAGMIFNTPETIFGQTFPFFSGRKDMVVFIGMPGSGKSTYYKKKLKPLGYIDVRQDKLKTKAKVLKEIESLMNSGKSIVIDSTNPSQEKRQIFYDIADKYGYTVTVVHFVVNGYGWNKLRKDTDGQHYVPDIVYHIYHKNFDAPTPENTTGDIFEVV